MKEDNVSAVPALALPATDDVYVVDNSSSRTVYEDEGNKNLGKTRDVGMNQVKDLIPDDCLLIAV